MAGCGYAVVQGLVKDARVRKVVVLIGWNCREQVLFLPNLGKAVRSNPSPSFGISSSKKPLDIGYRYMGNRRRAGFENPSNLCEALQVVHWPLVGVWISQATNRGA